MAQKNLDECLSEIIENAQLDREVTDKLMDNLLEEIQNSKASGDMEKHERAGVTLNKYLQTMQRANDQLIKVAKILSKREDEDDGGFNYDDIDFGEEVVLADEEEEEEVVEDAE